MSFDDSFKGLQYRTTLQCLTTANTWGYTDEECLDLMGVGETVEPTENRQLIRICRDLCEAHATTVRDVMQGIKCDKRDEFDGYISTLLDGCADRDNDPDLCLHREIGRAEEANCGFATQADVCGAAEGTCDRANAECQALKSTDGESGGGQDEEEGSMSALVLLGIIVVVLGVIGILATILIKRASVGRKSVTATFSVGGRMIKKSTSLSRLGRSAVAAVQAKSTPRHN